VSQIADEFAGHDDRKQLLAALDLTLAGRRLRADALPGRRRNYPQLA
jgi:hypothetical protein